ncbi:hypothetical protein P280DRAFT_509333 [Massarina eburnea CBS 473.64]|uniref:Uncharacterized protein n=1 Tax=Massarina eburnea CBS 473.64 TaxID=1395130 RepID=A0A6A6RSB5_9PLEO|nr:hypothetical protein P280DRAFT_509333 [Massarina eburnea CBS 473.64]
MAFGGLKPIFRPLLLIRIPLGDDPTRWSISLFLLRKYHCTTNLETSPNAPTISEWRSKEMSQPPASTMHSFLHPPPSSEAMTAQSEPTEGARKWYKEDARIRIESVRARQMRRKAAGDHAGAAGAGGPVLRRRRELDTGQGHGHGAGLREQRVRVVVDVAQALALADHHQEAVRGRVSNSNGSPFENMQASGSQWSFSGPVLALGVMAGVFMRL